MFKNKFNKSYDSLIGDSFYRDDATYFDLAQDRVQKILDLIKAQNIKTILDVGFYPGLIGRIIKDEFPNVKIYGTGKLNNVKDSKSYAWYEQITHSEFDPFYGQIQIPDYDFKFDLILATEIIEHLITPIELLKFSAKYLSNNGIFFLTTPNVSSIGAIARLAKCKSNYEALDKSVIFYNSDWRAHVRLYDKNELIELGSRFGLSHINHKYYLNAMIFNEKRKGLNWLIRILGSIVPFYREDQMIVYKLKK